MNLHLRVFLSAVAIGVLLVAYNAIKDVTNSDMSMWIIGLSWVIGLYGAGYLIFGLCRLWTVGKREM